MIPEPRSRQVAAALGEANEVEKERERKKESSLLILEKEAAPRILIGNLLFCLSAAN